MDKVLIAIATGAGTLQSVNFSTKGDWVERWLYGDVWGWLEEKSLVGYQIIAVTSIKVFHDGQLVDRVQYTLQLPVRVEPREEDA